MPTALSVISRALRMIGELAAETGEAPSAAVAEQALASLNGMLAGWENRGVRLNLPPLALADTIPLPASHDDAIAYNLAVSLAAEWDRDVSSAVATRAAEEFAALQAAYGHSGRLYAPLEYVLAGNVLAGRFAR